ncbi:MAG: thiamine-phosphate kinase [Paraperlucidibaca sp.]
MSIGEFELIRRYFVRDSVVVSGQPSLSAPQVVLGIGDDAALLEVPPGQRLVITTDTLVAGRHFLPDADPADIGWKSLAVNLSDLAAMSATLLGVTLNLTLLNADEAWLEGFAQGFWSLADLFDVPLIGGDTTRGPLSVTITAMGCVEDRHALRRSTARAGDVICVTGTLGDAGAGLALALGQADAALRGLSSADKLTLLGRLNRPLPQVITGINIRGFASAGMDISDGLLQDLGHLLSASGVGAEMQIDKLPLSDALKAYAATSPKAHAQARRWALSAGDDYELLVTVSPEMWQRLASFPAIKLTAIGKVTKTTGLRLTEQGKPWEHEGLAGYQHF